MSQIEKGGVIESKVIRYTILPRDSFGLSRAYFVNGLGCHNMFYLPYDYELTPYELMCKYYIYILIHSCDICNICYLLLMLYCALVLFLDWILFTERVVAQPLHLCLFPQV